MRGGTGRSWLRGPRFPALTLRRVSPSAGWALGPAPLIRHLQLTQQFIPFCVSSPLQVGLTCMWGPSAWGGELSLAADGCI